MGCAVVLCLRGGTPSGWVQSALLTCMSCSISVELPGANSEWFLQFECTARGEGGCG